LLLSSKKRTSDQATLSGSKTDPETDKWFSGSVFASGYSHIKKICYNGR
jgi:hypothetical protein